MRGVVKYFIYTLFISLTITLNASELNKLKPIIIGLDGEFGYKGSTSAEAISVGIKIAIREINEAGGVLNGRPLKLIEKASHSVPARTIYNIKSFNKMEDFVAIFCGKFSPTALEALPIIHELKIPLLDPWAAADPITDNRFNPNYAFRLSLKDSWAMPTMMKYSKFKGAKNIGLLLMNTGWGRSNLKVAKKYAKKDKDIKIVKQLWFNWDIKTFLDKYEELRRVGAESIIFVGNANEAKVLLKEVANLPEDKQIPIIAHWGVSGGKLAQMSGEALHKVDFSLIQTYSFIDDNSTKAIKVANSAKEFFNVKSVRELPSPVGIAHAYDLTHILALAINKAGSTNREKIRDELEKIENYDGLIKRYNPPFTKKNHEALNEDLVFIAKYAKEDNAIVRIWPKISKEKK